MSRRQPRSDSKTAGIIYNQNKITHMNFREEVASMAHDPFGASTPLNTSSGDVEIYSLKKLDGKVEGDVFSLPFSIRVMLESLLRNAGGKFVSEEDVEALANWPESIGGELAYLPARVVMQDFTGVPAIVGLAAMRSAVKGGGGGPEKKKPLMARGLGLNPSGQGGAFGPALGPP